MESLIKNPTLSDLVGGIQSVTLGDDEAKRLIRLDVLEYQIKEITGCDVKDGEEEQVLLQKKNIQVVEYSRNYKK